jgi:hypothetical protein
MKHSRHGPIHDDDDDDDDIDLRSMKMSLTSFGVAEAGSVSHCVLIYV